MCPRRREEAQALRRKPGPAGVERLQRAAQVGAGQRIRQARTERRLTLVDLAGRSVGVDGPRQRCDSGLSLQLGLQHAILPKNGRERARPGVEADWLRSQRVGVEFGNGRRHRWLDRRWDVRGHTPRAGRPTAERPRRCSSARQPPPPEHVPTGRASRSFPGIPRIRFARPGRRLRTARRRTAWPSGQAPKPRRTHPIPKASVLRAPLLAVPRRRGRSRVPQGR